MADRALGMDTDAAAKGQAHSREAREVTPAVRLTLLIAAALLRDAWDAVLRAADAWANSGVCACCWQEDCWAPPGH